MQNRIEKLILVVLSLLELYGCQGLFSGVPASETTRQQESWIPKDIRELAGPWEYQDESGQGILVLDQAGKGGYDWKDGWFQTDSLEDGVWKGWWFQAENDREGRFEMKFTNDSPIVPGDWW